MTCDAAGPMASIDPSDAIFDGGIMANRTWMRLLSLGTCGLMALGVVAAEAQAPVSQGAVNATVTIRADQPGPVINPNIYGQFAEHLGAGIYEGIWVGEKSPIPNTNGYRNDVVAALKALHVPVVRWPGGCFADEYHWRDGIGPREKRPVKVNTHYFLLGKSGAEWDAIVRARNLAAYVPADFPNPQMELVVVLPPKAR